MDNRTYSAYFIFSYLQLHGIRYIELSLQNMCVAISKAKTVLSLFFCKECIPSTVIYRYLEWSDRHYF